MVRCQCQKKAKQGEKIKFRPVHKGERGASKKKKKKKPNQKKNTGGCSTFWGRKTWEEGHETEGDCWRICVHLNPEREKVTDSHRNSFQLFFSFFFLTDHTSVRCAPPPLPPPSFQPHWGSGSSVKDALRAPEWWWWRRVGQGLGAFSHPRVKYQLWLCEHTHCAYLLAYAHTHCRADLNILKLPKKKKKHIFNAEKSTLYCNVFVWAIKQRLNVVHHWNGNARCCRFRPSWGVRSFLRSGLDSWPVLFDWVCLLTSPAVVNCIKAVSGSMATFYNSYVYRERISKAQRISAGKDSWDKTEKKKKPNKNKQNKITGRRISCFLWNVSVQHVEHRQHIHKNEILQ